MRRLFSLFAAALTLAACSKEFTEIMEPEEELVTVEMEAEGDDLTKTIYNEGSVSWSEGDIVRYYSKDNGSISQITITSYAQRFLAFAYLLSAKYVIAIYGGTGLTNNTSEGARVIDGVPEEQTGVFGDHHITAAKTTNIFFNRLSFQNVTSCLKFSLTREDIKYIVFTANDGTQLHGNGTVDLSFETGRALGSFPTAGGSSIRVNTNGAGSFFITTLPCTMEKGFTIDCYGDNDEYLGTAKSSKTATVALDRMLNLGTLDSRIKNNYIDLSETESANCYVVSSSHAYKFKATKGNSATSVGEVAGAKVLWESFGNTEYPAVGDLVRDVTSDGEYVYFNASHLRGNALIAAVDSEDNILWSWHIWMTEKPEDQLYYGNAGTFLDRNLGATSAEPGEIEANGMLYQWGRKDPQVPATYGIAVSLSNYQLTETVANAVKDGNALQYSIANPMTFITSGSTSGYDWYNNATSSKNNTLWSNSKTIYDPCPPNYRVPRGGTSSVWVTAMNSSSENTSASYWDADNKGVNFGASRKKLGTSPTIWYPAAGYLITTGAHSSRGTLGAYWSCSYSGTKAYGLTLNASDVKPSDLYYRGAGRSVRCTKIKLN